jgi:hypothetical protein
MASLDTPYLNETEEDAIRALHKSVRATRYEDPVDQDAFLVAAARSIVRPGYSLPILDSLPLSSNSVSKWRRSR